MDFLKIGCYLLFLCFLFALQACSDTDLGSCGRSATPEEIQSAQISQLQAESGNKKALVDYFFFYDVEKSSVCNKKVTIFYSLNLEKRVNKDGIFIGSPFKLIYNLKDGSSKIVVTGGP